MLDSLDLHVRNENAARLRNVSDGAGSQRLLVLFGGGRIALLCVSPCDSPGEMRTTRSTAPVAVEGLRSDLGPSETSHSIGAMSDTTKPPRPPATNKARRVAFKPVEGNRPADGIQSQIRKLIASQKLKSGDRLPTERDLAEQFAVSRNTVRQAIRSLADGGLLEVKKGATGGAFIRGGGAAAVRAGLVDLYSLGTIQPAHLTEARVLIGVEVVRLACERGTEEDLEQLAQNVELAQEAAKAGDVERRTAINLEFYRILARMSHNPLLEIVTDAVLVITARFVEDFARASNAAVMPFRRKLLEDLRQRDATAAAERMHEHLVRLQKIYLSEIAARNRPIRGS